MSEPGFSLEQLMELAGLSVAEAVYQVVQEKRLDHQPRILLVCGPGNNGGDGLVAARHLVMFGYQSTVVYPKQVKKQHYINLVQQCEDVGIQIREDLPEDLSEYDAIVDAIFGFSFHGTPRPPFDTILQAIANAEALTVAVDVPSGWNVDKGDVAGTGFVPDVLVSLTAPKLSAKQFTGRHFVGGRFLPPALGEKYGVRMPRYPGVAQVVEVGKTRRPADWEEGYAAYLAEKQAKEEAAASGQSWADQESWEHQYAAYLAVKEAKEREGFKMAVVEFFLMVMDSSHNENGC